MSFKKRRIATLDLGSNSLLLLVAERSEEGALTILADESETPRLGEGLHATKMISEPVLSRVADAVDRMAKNARDLGAEEIRLTATAAAREAENREQLVEAVRKRTDLEMEILSPSEEARLTYLSATVEKEGQEPCMVFDIGGGSTEVTWGLGPRFDGGRSLNLGTVKLLEGFLQEDPPSPEAVERARIEIDRQLARVVPLPKMETYYGTAGSFTHLASIDLALQEYHSEKVSGHGLDRERIESWVSRLLEMTREEKLNLPGIDPRRVDVLIPGTLIIERLFQKFDPNQIIVVDRGIRFGNLFSILRKFIPPVRFSAS